MSKQILIVDLLDDDECKGCKLAGLCNHSRRVSEDEEDRDMEFFHEMRGPTCPLIPVGKETKYEVTFFEDRSAGIFGGSEIVTISYVGDMGGEVGEFEEYIRECLQDWTDGGTAVVLSDEFGLEEEG